MNRTLSVREQIFGEHVLLVNGADWTAAGASEEQATIIRELGYTVVNAPRPLPCAIAYDAQCGPQLNLEWTGDFLHGTFYAAGPADSPINEHRPDGPTYADRWRENDAWPVRLVTNADLEAALRTRYETNKYLLDGLFTPRPTFEQAIEKIGGMAEAMAAYGLPWREP